VTFRLDPAATYGTFRLDVLRRASKRIAELQDMARHLDSEVENGTLLLRESEAENDALRQFCHDVRDGVIGLSPQDAATIAGWKARAGELLQDCPVCQGAGQIEKQEQYEGGMLMDAQEADRIIAEKGIGWVLQGNYWRHPNGRVVERDRKLVTKLSFHPSTDRNQLHEAEAALTEELQSIYIGRLVERLAGPGWKNPIRAYEIRTAPADICAVALAEVLNKAKKGGDDGTQGG